MERRGLRRVGFSALALGLVALITWPIAASIARGSVAVYPDARTFICDGGKTLFAQDNNFPDQGYTAAVVVTPDLDCYLQFHVRNDGAVPIYFHGASFSLSGPENRRGTTVDMIDDQAAVPSRDGFDVALSEEQPLEISPGGDFLLTAHLTYNDNACLGEGTTYTDMGPDISISALGIPATVRPVSGGYATIGSRSNHCD